MRSFLSQAIMHERYSLCCGDESRKLKFEGGNCRIFSHYEKLLKIIIIEFYAKTCAGGFFELLRKFKKIMKK